MRENGTETLKGNTAVITSIVQYETNKFAGVTRSAKMYRFLTLRRFDGQLTLTVTVSVKGGCER